MKTTTIQAVAWRSHEGLPWELGALTKVTIQFTDKDGSIADVARKLGKTREKARATIEQALEAKPARRRYLFWLKSMYDRAEQHLLNRGKKLIRKVLRRHVDAIDLKADSGGAGPFEAVTGLRRIDEIREEIEAADRWDLWIVAAA